MFDPIEQLFTRIEDNPLDEEARLEYESLLRAKSPTCREVRYLELERQLAALVDSPEDFAAILRRLDDFQRAEFNWDDRLWTYVMPRLFDLWLESFEPSLQIAVENALRLRCGILLDGNNTVMPLLIAEKSPALAQDGVRSGIIEFICRYKHKPDDEQFLSSDELRMTIRPSWKQAI